MPTKNNKGFTLLELLIVLVVIGVIAGLMFPVLTANIEKGRGQEAAVALGTVKEAMVKYWQTTGNSSYAGATLDSTATQSWIGFDPNASAAGQSPLFTYTVNALAGNGFTIHARRIGTTTNYLEIKETGDIKRFGVYS